MAVEIHVNDVGTEFSVTVYDGQLVLDLAGPSNLQLKFKKPDGSTLLKSATISDDKLSYTTVSGDIDQVGVWSLQAVITYTSNVYRSDVQQFKVYPNL
jgi:hypothetical protein